MQSVYFSYYLIKKIIFECNKCIIEPLKHLKITAKIFMKYFQNYSIAPIFLSPVKQNFRCSTVFETCTFSSSYSQSFSSKCRVKYFRMNITAIIHSNNRKEKIISFVIESYGKTLKSQIWRINFLETSFSFTTII